MKKDLLKKYLNNSCSEKEFGEVADWVITEGEKKEGKSWSFDIWNSFVPEPEKKDEKKYSVLLDKIHHEINLKGRNTRKTLFGNVITWLGRAAAVLFIPLLCVLIYLISNNNFQFNHYSQFTVDSLEIIAPIGSRTVVQLSDGTKVNLNYGSRIKYPKNFTGKTREISLEGEGYFDIAHDPEHPFIVKTGKLNVKALGTEFNVQAYPDDDEVKTTLVDGKVVVERILTGENVEQLKTMVPGQHVVYGLNSGKVLTIQGNINKYIAWKNGKLVFDNEPIEEVGEKLGRMFNVDIEIADEIKDYTYTVTLENDPLFLILDLMSEITNIRYKAYPRKKLPDGTFSKQKIRIEKRQ